MYIVCCSSSFESVMEFLYIWLFKHISYQHFLWFQINSYMCTCQPGYHGSHCENETNECIPDPCVYGDCVDLVAAYRFVVWEKAPLLSTPLVLILPRSRRIPFLYPEARRWPSSTVYLSSAEWHSPLIEKVGSRSFEGLLRITPFYRTTLYKFCCIY